MVGVGGERAALAGFEVHDVVADGAAAQFAGGAVGFVEEGEVDAEGGVGWLGAGDGLEDEVDGCAALERGELGGDVGEDAALGGDRVALADGVDEAEEGGGGGDVVGGGVDADDGVAGAEEEAVDDGGGDADGVVGWVVGLEAGGETAGQADGGAEAGDDADFAGDGDEVLHAHELGDGGGHLGGEAGGEGGKGFGGGFVGEETVAELADGEGGDGGEGCGVVGVEMRRVTSSVS